MSDTVRLGVPYLLPNQAQKHVTLNEGLSRLDTLVQLVAVSAALSAEPGAPDPGAIYLLPEDASGTNWVGRTTGTIACFRDGGWEFIMPGAGWQAFDLERGQQLVWLDGRWQGAPVAEVRRLGINCNPDAVNRLAVKSDAELLSHDDVTPGSGDARKIINRAASTDTASVLFQTGFAGQAEVGLTGDGNLHLRVSDGATWRDGVLVEADTGAVSFPEGLVHHASRARQAGLLLLSGGDGEVSVFRNNAARSPAARTYTLSGVVADTLTLTAAVAEHVFLNAFMEGVSLLRVWNISRVPAEPAWVRRTNGSAELQVTVAGDIGAWLTGDTLQVGDPVSVTPNGCIALDVSPMLSAQLGAVFPQAGLLLKIGVAGALGGEVGLDLSPTGASGSFAGARSTAAGGLQIVQVTVPTSVPSPVSASNLLFVREQGGSGAMGVSLISAVGVLA